MFAVISCQKAIIFLQKQWMLPERSISSYPNPKQRYILSSRLFSPRPCLPPIQRTIFVRFRLQFLQIIIISMTTRPSIETIPLKRKPRAVSSFLKKTYELLNDLENEQTVRWAGNGIGFVVVDEQAFSKEVLPRYFKHSNYSSFVRQLNMYNFHKIRENNSESYFHHHSFDRTNQLKLADIRRKPEKKKRKNEDSEEEVQSENEENMQKQPAFVKRIKEEQRAYREASLQKVEEQKNTRHFVSEEEHPRERCSLRNIEEGDDDKLSINNDISERVIPRLATRELINPSNSNLFPFGAGKGQTSTFCLFY